jgi:hypothetical protein
MELLTEVGDESVVRLGWAHEVADLVFCVHRLRERAQREADHGLLEPVLGREQDRIVSGHSARHALK